MRESKYQRDLVKRIEDRFPGCHIERGDPSRLQGIPDLTIFYNRCWAKLEVKAHASATFEPNQPYYIEMFNNMSFAAVIHPENEEEVLDALQHAFSDCGATCVPQSKHISLDQVH